MGGGGGANGDPGEANAINITSGHETSNKENPPPAPALQVIVLGSGGGPLESNVTAFLVRPIAAGWRRGSVIAVDAGVHLGAIEKILAKTQPATLGEDQEHALPYTLTTGPFAGLQLPTAASSANASFIHRTLIDTYLITHPHLDHIAGFVINTAGLGSSRPKKLAGLPHTIAAFKTHIFNNVIWPNLSDENNGVGLVTYTRLVEGGSPALGEGESKGYLEITDDLAVKVWAVSHGHCFERHTHRGSGSLTRPASFDAASMGPSPMSVMSPTLSHLGPRGLAHHNSISAASNSLAAFIQQQQQQQQQQRDQDRMSIHPGNLFGGGGRSNSISGFGGGGHATGESICVCDSSAYFIRDVTTGRELIIFGDVEPDSVSLSPRNRNIWREAAPKIASGKLTAIFIECSFDDSQADDRLFGHLTPRYIVQEMTVLAEEVTAARMDILRRQYEKEHGIKRQSTSRPGPMGRSYSDYGNASSDKKRKRAEEEDRNTRRRTITSHARAASTNPRFRTKREPSTAAGADKNQQQPQPSQQQQDPRHPTEDAISPKSGKRYGNRLSSSSAQAAAAAAAASTTSLHDKDGVNPRNPTGFVMDTPHLATPTGEMSLDDFQQRATVNHQPQFNTSLQQHQMGGGLSRAADLPQFHLSAPTSPYSYGSPSFSPTSNAMSMSSNMSNPALPAPAAAPAAVHLSQLKHPLQNPSSSSNSGTPSGSGLVSSASNVTPATSMSLYLNGATQDMMDTDSNADVDVNAELARRLPEQPLEGLKVVIIHVKDRMVDGPSAGEVIMEQLAEHEEEVRLGVEWVLSFAGQEVFV
ncbi:cAMP phosphodiesterases class-II-domain-containing protein [Pseudoneurospora amorphoporcata]|uniref:cAMP phosphodiesterases class-II-domain-containing protein n=1 Tax=Pseudoneurospora amorphoporcata TaxID=241081 RepID=A0AAN6NY22_9PEZI|nr:cAMP phosphodiesterases class-II-domain-containing protein [Pseudoneurospora amorphoporcata]